MNRNRPSAWRFARAHHLASLYTSNPDIAAVIVGGSTARGSADMYSDIELGVFWAVPPTEAARHSVIAAAGADLVRLYPYDPDEEVWEDAFMLGRAAPDQPQSGVLVEVGHYTVDFMERTLTRVVDQYDPDENKLNLLSGIVDGVALHNPELISRWRQKAVAYPDALTLAVIRRHVQIDHFWRSHMYLERQSNLMLLYQSFNQIHHKLLHCLLAINHVYYFGFKWLNEVEARLPLAPPNLVDRIRVAYQIPPANAAPHVASLVEEVYDLIEQQVTGVDVERLRHIFRWQRPLWASPPPF